MVRLACKYSGKACRKPGKLCEMEDIEVQSDFFSLEFIAI
jgi:hypothetical protein